MFPSIQYRAVNLPRNSFTGCRAWHPEVLSLKRGCAGRTGQVCLTGSSSVRRGPRRAGYPAELTKTARARRPPVSRPLPRRARRHAQWSLAPVALAMTCAANARSA